MVSKNFYRISFVLMFLSVNHIYCFVATNFLRFDDPVWRIPPHQDSWFGMHVALEAGDSCRGKNLCSDRDTIFSLYDTTQSVIAMLENPVGNAKKLGADRIFPPASTIGPFTDDGQRGRVKLSGNFEQTNVSLFGRFSPPFFREYGIISLGVYVPFISKQVSGLAINDVTQDNFGSEKLIKRFIENLPAEASRLGCLDMTDCWSASGIGDIIIRLDWYSHYVCGDGCVKGLDLFAHVGILAPTSTEKDEDVLLSMPIDYDGAWGVVAGFGLAADFVELPWCGHFRLGFDVDLLFLMSKTRERRLKTSLSQTGLLLLNKAEAKKEYGTEWQFEAFIRWANIWKGLYTQMTYQYREHKEDELTVCAQGFSNEIVNTANDLKGWDVHNVFFHIGYDFGRLLDRFDVRPQLGFFYKISLDGSGIIDHDSYGFHFGVSF